MNAIVFLSSHQLISPRILRSTECKAAVVTTTLTERIVTPSELARHLLIGGPAPGHQHYVEPGEAADGEKHQGDDHHDNHRDNCGHLGTYYGLDVSLVCYNIIF